MASAMPAQKRHRKAFASPPPSLSAPLPGGTALPPPLPSRAPTTPPPPPPSRAPTTPPPPSRAPTTTRPPPPAPTATPAAATAPAPGRQLQSLQKDLSFSRLTLEDYAVFPDSMVDSGQEALAPAVAVRKSQSSQMKKKLKPESKVMKGGFMAKCVVTEPPQNAAVSAKSPPEKGIDMVFGSSRQQSSVSSVMECLGGLSSPAPSLLENIRVGGMPLKKAEKILTPEPQGSKSKDAVVTELDEHVVLTAMSPPEKEINLSMASASGQDPSSVQAWACLSQESIPAGKNLMKTRKLRRRPPAMNASSPAVSDSQPKLRKESPQLLKASEVLSSSRMNRGRASIVHRKVMSDVPKNRVVLDSALLPHMETTDETPTKVTGLETRFRCANFKTFDNIFKVQRSDGSWEFCDHLFVALMIDYTTYEGCRNKLYSAGLKSLGCRVEEAMLSLTATAIVLGQFLFFLLPVQFMELDFSNFLHDIESIDVDKARDEITKKLDGHTDKSAAVYDLVMRAVRFCEETVAAHPMVCSQLELGRSWDYFLADINGFIRNKASTV